MKRAESYERMAMHMRRRIAAALFAPPAIARAIDEAASLGYRSYRVVQAHPFDLSETAAAKNLETWLTDEHFQFAWRPTFIVRDPLRPGQATEYPELVVMW